MTDPDSLLECLSVDDHDDQSIHDLHSHFFGCIEIDRRVDFLRQDNRVWSRLAEQSGNGDAKFTRYTAAMSLLGDIRRVRVLRNELLYGELHDLDSDIKNSGGMWREFAEHRRSINVQPVCLAASSCFLPHHPLTKRSMPGKYTKRDNAVVWSFREQRQ